MRVQGTETSDGPITCRELIAFIADYLEGALAPQARRAFEAHLTMCPSCVAYLDGYKRTIALGKEALRPSDEPASGQVPEGLVRAIRQARKGS